MKGGGFTSIGMIPDIGGYLGKMQKSVYDKIFFVDKIFDPAITTILDYGCADGSLLKAVHLFFPNVRLIGYDVSPEMIERAKKNVPFAEFYDKWEDIKCDSDKTLINLSSVIHEVYSYGTPDEIECFWRNVLYSGFRTIAIRDMTFRDSDKINSCSSHKWHLKQYKKVTQNKQYADKLADFENHLGHSIQNNVELQHFLMKYRYDENWQRELLENYLPISVESLMKIISSVYTCTYERIYTLPFIQHQINKDFGFWWTLPTHCQLIFEKS